MIVTRPEDESEMQAAGKLRDRQFLSLYAAWVGSETVRCCQSASKVEVFRVSKSRSPDAACARICSATSSADADLRR